MTTKRWAALLGSVVLLLVVGAGAAPATGAAEPRGPLVALVGNGTTESVALLDPVSLRRLRGRPRVYVGLHDIPHSFSPDGSLLALGSGRTGSLVIVDVRRMRRLAKLDSGFTAAIAWISESRLVVVEGRWVNDQRVLRASVVRIGRRTRVVAQHVLPAGLELIRFGGAQSAAVLLLAPGQAIGHATLAVLTESGLRSVALTGIPAGVEAPDITQEQPVGRYAYPGLAVDPDGGHAYVVPGEGPVAAIDLSGLGVVYHELRSARQVAATADGGANVLGDGFSREAAWLGGRRLAVSGHDDWTEIGPDGRFVQRSAPAGLRLIDIGGWTEEVVDDRAERLTWSGSYVAAVSSEPWLLSVFAPDGALRFRRRLPPGGFKLAGGLAYLTLGNEYRRHRVRVVELATGRTLSTVHVPGWFYPLSREVPDSCWC